MKIVVARFGAVRVHLRHVTVGLPMSPGWLHIVTLQLQLAI